MRLFLTLVPPVLAFMGCASAPPMSYEEHSKLAGLWYATEQCAGQGLMTPETAGLALRQVRMIASRSTVNQNLLNARHDYYRDIEQPRVDAQMCNRLAADSESYRHVVDQPAQASAVAPAPLWPKMGVTSCSQVGSQTLCHTY